MFVLESKPQVTVDLDRDLNYFEVVVFALWFPILHQLIEAYIAIFNSYLVVSLRLNKLTQSLIFLSHYTLEDYLIVSALLPVYVVAVFIQIVSSVNIETMNLLVVEQSLLHLNFAVALYREVLTVVLLQRIVILAQNTVQIGFRHLLQCRSIILR